MSNRTTSVELITDWLSRSTATFAGVFLALLLAGIITELYLEFKINRALNAFDAQMKKEFKGPAKGFKK